MHTDMILFVTALFILNLVWFIYNSDVMRRNRADYTDLCNAADCLDAAGEMIESKFADDELDTVVTLFNDAERILNRI